MIRIKIILLIITACFVLNVNAQNKKLEYGFIVNITKKQSEKYMILDSSGSENYKVDKVFIPKNNYVSMGIFLTHRFHRKLLLNYEMRIKHWGFKEIFFIPNIVTAPEQQPFRYYGTKSYVNTFDCSVSLSKEYKIHSKFYIFPKVGLSVFRPISKGFDSAIYLNFGSDIELNYNYVGPVYKLGYNLGLDVYYRFTKKYSLRVGANFYSPFNNTNNWIYALRVTGVNYPWIKYRKKTSALYFGLGISKSIFK